MYPNNGYIPTMAYASGNPPVNPRFQYPGMMSNALPYVATALIAILQNQAPNNAFRQMAYNHLCQQNWDNPDFQYLWQIATANCLYASQASRCDPMQAINPVCEEVIKGFISYLWFTYYNNDQNRVDNYDMRLLQEGMQIHQIHVQRLNQVTPGQAPYYPTNNNFIPNNNAPMGYVDNGYRPVHPAAHNPAAYNAAANAAAMNRYNGYNNGYNAGPMTAGSASIGGRFSRLAAEDSVNNTPSDYLERNLINHNRQVQNSLPSDFSNISSANHPGRAYPSNQTNQNNAPVLERTSSPFKTMTGANYQANASYDPHFQYVGPKETTIFDSEMASGSNKIEQAYQNLVSDGVTTANQEFFPFDPRDPETVKEFETLGLVEELEALKLATQPKPIPPHHPHFNQNPDLTYNPRRTYRLNPSIWENGLIWEPSKSQPAWIPFDVWRWDCHLRVNEKGHVVQTFTRKEYRDMKEEDHLIETYVDEHRNHYQSPHPTAEELKRIRDQERILQLDEDELAEQEKAMRERKEDLSILPQVEEDLVEASSLENMFEQIELKGPIKVDTSVISKGRIKYHIPSEEDYKRVLQNLSKSSTFSDVVSYITSIDRGTFARVKMVQIFGDLTKVVLNDHLGIDIDFDDIMDDYNDIVMILKRNGDMDAFEREMMHRLKGFLTYEKDEEPVDKDGEKFYHNTFYIAANAAVFRNRMHLEGESDLFIVDEMVNPSLYKIAKSMNDEPGYHFIKLLSGNIYRVTEMTYARDRFILRKVKPIV